MTKLAAAFLAPLALTVALSGCAGTANPNTPEGQKQIAAEAKSEAATEAKEGHFCEASQLEENNGTYADECIIQKDKEAREKEVGKENEETREGLRLKEEGRAP